MNEAKKHLDAGNLNEAIEEALNAVKSKPTDGAARTFLFELALFAGDYDRAEKQLDVIGHQDMNAMIGSKIFRQNLKAERDRLRYFSDSQMPEFLMSPPAYIENLIHANNRLREGNAQQARELLDKVEEERPAFAAKVNGETVSDFRDYNDATCCIFEAIVKDNYVWLPFEQIEKISFTPPKNLRDLFWAQANVEMTNGTNGEMFIPALYANSWRSDNDQVRLGRMTDWHDAGSEIFTGEGMRLFWFDGRDKGILELKEIEFVREQ